MFASRLGGQTYAAAPTYASEPISTYAGAPTYASATVSTYAAAPTYSSPVSTYAAAPTYSTYAGAPATTYASIPSTYSAPMTTTYAAAPAAYSSFSGYPGYQGGQVISSYPAGGQAFSSQMIMQQPQVMEQVAAPADQTTQLRQLFHQADQNGDNQLSIQEFANVADQIGIQMPDLLQAYADFDADHDGRISCAEFMSIFHPTPQAPPGSRPMSAPCPGVPDDGKFVDPEFPPDRDSVLASPNPQGDHIDDFLHGTNGGQFRWMRASDVCGNEKLFDKVHPNDIMQGVLGDCWLLAGLAGIAEFEGKIFHLFEEKVVSPDGMYHVHIMNAVTREWETVTIDDYIPVDMQGQPTCAKPAGAEMWVLLLEKACAKWFGSYIQLMGAFAMVPFMLLTELSGNVKCFSQRQIGPGQFDVMTYDAKEAFLQDPHNRNSVSMTPQGDISEEQLWAEMQNADDQNFIMACWTTKDGEVAGRGASGEAIAADGIVKGHAYSLIAVDEYNCDGQNWRVVRVRNPWGNNPAAEWKGELSDNWPEWPRYPQLMAALNINSAQLDGMFWMPWDAFRNRFSDLGIAPQAGSTTKLGKVEMACPVFPPGGKHAKQFRKAGRESAEALELPVAAMADIGYAQQSVVQYPSAATYSSPVTYAAAPATYSSPVTYASAPVTTYASAPSSTYASAPMSATYSSPVSTYAAAPTYSSPVTTSYASPATSTYASAPVSTYASAPVSTYAAASTYAAPSSTYSAAPAYSSPTSTYAAAPTYAAASTYSSPVSTYAGAPAATYSSPVSTYAGAPSAMYASPSPVTYSAAPTTYASAPTYSAAPTSYGTSMAPTSYGTSMASTYSAAPASTYSAAPSYPAAAYSDAGYSRRLL